MDKDTKEMLQTLDNLMEQLADVWNDVDYIWKENKEVDDLMFDNADYYPFERSFDAYSWDIVDWTDDVRKAIKKKLNEK